MKWLRENPTVQVIYLKLSASLSAPCASREKRERRKNHTTASGARFNSSPIETRDLLWFLWVFFCFWDYIFVHSLFLASSCGVFERISEYFCGMFVYRFSVTSEIFFYWSIESASGDGDRRRLMIAAWHFKLSDFFSQRWKFARIFRPKWKAKTLMTLTMKMMT